MGPCTLRVETLAEIWFRTGLPFGQTAGLKCGFVAFAVLVCVSVCFAGGVRCSSVTVWIHACFNLFPFLFASGQPVWSVFHPSHVTGRGHARSGQPLWSVLPACRFRRAIRCWRWLRTGTRLQRRWLRLPTIPRSEWRFWHGDHRWWLRPLWRSASQHGAAFLRGSTAARVPGPAWRGAAGVPHAATGTTGLPSAAGLRSGMGTDGRRRRCPAAVHRQSLHGWYRAIAS